MKRRIYPVDGASSLESCTMPPRFRGWRQTASLLLLLLGFPATLAAQTIRGTLRDAESDQPLDGGLVALLTEDSVQVSSALTDNAGAFVLNATVPGAYRLQAQRLGYRPSISPALELESGDTLQIDFRLSTEALVLSPVVVTAQPRRLSGALGGFYQRAERRAWGNFVTREDIERQRPIRTTDLLRTMAGVQLVPVRGGSAVLIRGCAPAIYLDGMRFRLAGMTIDELVHPDQLEGIEIYRSGAEVPAEYGFGAGCGAILLWRRR